MALALVGKLEPRKLVLMVKRSTTAKPEERKCTQCVHSREKDTGLQTDRVVAKERETMIVSVSAEKLVTWMIVQREGNNRVAFT